MQNLLLGLNPEQRRAVEATEGPVLIVAGAGAGKTKTLTHRIGHLIEKGVPPEAILAITLPTKQPRKCANVCFAYSKEHPKEDHGEK